MAREYEVQIKIEDNVNPLVAQNTLWKSGDIVDIHPKGWVWSKLEVERFLIASVGSLEESEARALVEEVVVAYEEVDKDGVVNVRTELIANSRYRLDITALLDKLPGTAEERTKIRKDVLDRGKEAQPLLEHKVVIEPSDIEDITLRSEVIELVADRQAALSGGGARC